MPAIHRPSRTAYQSDINMLPMIDILLVLLILFMIRPKELQEPIQLPQPNAGAAAPIHPQIVLTVTPTGYLINDQPLPDASLEAHLRAIYSGREVKLLFVRGLPTVPYREVIRGIDRARGAGVQIIAHQPSFAGDR